MSGRRKCVTATGVTRLEMSGGVVLAAKGTHEEGKPALGSSPASPVSGSKPSSVADSQSGAGGQPKVAMKKFQVDYEYIADGMLEGEEGGELVHLETVVEAENIQQALTEMNRELASSAGIKSDARITRIQEVLP